MMLKNRDLPVSTYRQTLPPFLGDDKNPTPIEFKIRPSGPVNIAYMSAIEPFLLKSKVAVQELEAIEKIADKVRADHDKAKEMAEDRLAIFYDACVVEWSSGIMDEDTGKPIPNDRATFLELCKIRVPEIAGCIVELEKAARTAGEMIDAEDEKTAKN